MMKNKLIFIFFTLLTCLISYTSTETTKKEALSFFNKGEKLYSNENYSKALEEYLKSKAIYEKNSSTDNLLYIRILRRIGDCYYYLSNYKNAINFYQTAIEKIDSIIKKQKNKKLLIHKGHLLTMLGNILKFVNCEKAIHYYKQSLEIYKKTGYKIGIGGCYLNIGDCLAKKGDLNSAIEYTKKAIKYFNPNDFYSLSIVYSNLSDYYIDKHDFEKAISLINKSIEYSLKGNRKRQLIFNYIKLGKLKKAQKKCNEALTSFNKALELSKKINDKDAIRKTLLLMGNCYANSGNYEKAYNCAMEFIKNSRELFSKQLIEQLAALESKQKSKLMEKKLKTLEKSSQIQEKSLFLHKTTLAVVIIFVVILFWLLWHRQKLIEEIEQKNKNLEMLIGTVEKVSKTDDLTGLPNRRGLFEFLEREISRAIRQKEKFSFAICDLDNFKRINDNFSHQVGDIVLMAVSKTFQDLTRKVDIVARFGGEEFIFVFPSTPLKNAKKVCEKIRKTIEETEFVVFDTPIKITLTFGVTEFTPQKNFETLLQEADKALYLGKETGKNKVVTYFQYLEK
ncbi:signal transduction protein [Thermotomaculum hydrothermale]|uniref:diguanylate cyclase n=1 Tax=Thermotomaculum hydrothermale TaxID=981385 RepID=A0A7R6PSS3_9BACT|nr:tetratricopeptide repeat-containing diguanylate cyclase [Thermotomaculum hydrothermale]BBB33656.1 signal transduction protein [Thermotomaculum hydrothermale]